MASTPQALRILQSSCDSEIDSPEAPLALWDNLEKDVRGGWFGNIQVRHLHSCGFAAFGCMGNASAYDFIRLLLGNPMA